MRKGQKIDFGDIRAGVTFERNVVKNFSFDIRDQRKILNKIEVIRMKNNELDFCPKFFRPADRFFRLENIFFGILSKSFLCTREKERKREVILLLPFGLMLFR